MVPNLEETKLALVPSPRKKNEDPRQNFEEATFNL
jgi:hypothetical protein